MVKAVNKATALFDGSGAAANIVKTISNNLQQDLAAASEVNKHALGEAMASWQTVGTHWKAISDAVLKEGAHIRSLLNQFSQVLQQVVEGIPQNDRVQAAFNAEEFESSRQQLLDAYKLLQELFNDKDLAMSLAAVNADLKVHQQNSPPQYQKLWNRASILWNEALKHWGILKQEVGNHPQFMNTAMKKTFQHWNSVASGQPTQPAQPLPGEKQQTPIKDLIAVMLQKARMQGPSFAKQFESIVQSTPEERLRPWLEQQLLGQKAASVRITAASRRLSKRYPWVLHIAAETVAVDDAVKLVPPVLLDMLRTTQDAKLKDLTPSDLQQDMLDVTQIFTDAVRQNATLWTPVRDAWNQLATLWADVDSKWEGAGVELMKMTPPLQTAATNFYKLLKQKLSAEPAVAKDEVAAPAVPLQNPQETMQQVVQQPPPQQKQMQASVMYKGAKYVRVDL